MTIDEFCKQPLGSFKRFVQRLQNKDRARTSRKVFMLTSLTFDARKTRTWGFFFTLEDAKQAVKENEGDMEERLYDHLVIEEYGEGVFTLPFQEIWFSWNHETKEWHSSAKPEFTPNIVCWALR